MSRRIPEEIIQEIRERSDIVEVVSSYLSLKRSGANHQGLCPFHSEKTPSFNVNSTRQIFHCFGCGVGGNAFSFLMKIEGLSFPDAVRRLGERVGVEVPEEQLSPAEEKRRAETERLVRINEVAAEFYHQLLLDSDEGAPARRYLRQRGYDSETVRQYRLGYAPERWEALAGHLQEKGFELPLVREKLGLIRAGKEGRGDYDLFRKRLLFPILDIRGQVVAFGGRVLDDSLPKYINSPESPIYHKSRTLFGLSQAREAMRRDDYGIVVEGYFDQMALHRAGFANSVATCGTALTAEHGRLLKRYTEKLLLFFDQDKAGRQATFRAMEVLLPEGLSVSVVIPEEGQDPDSLLAAEGEEGLRQRLEAARPVLEYFIDLTLAEHGDQAEGKARAVEIIIDKLRLLKSDIERDLYLKSLAERTGLDELMLRRKTGSSRPAPARQEMRRTEPLPAQAEPARPAGGMEKAQDLLLRLFIDEPRIRDKVEPGQLPVLFFDDARSGIARELFALAAPGQPIAAGQLQDRLDEEQNRLLSALLMREVGATDEELDRLFADCCQTIVRTRARERQKQLPQLIRQAESDGDFAAVENLQRELLELKKKL